jgi:hypothetical protein
MQREPPSRWLFLCRKFNAWTNLAISPLERRICLPGGHLCYCNQITYIPLSGDGEGEGVRVTLSCARSSQKKGQLAVFGVSDQRERARAFSLQVSTAGDHEVWLFLTEKPRRAWWFLYAPEVKRL